jgi:hypothetical protein
VLESSKRATHHLPAADLGDLVLIAITKTTLPKGQKSIQWVARLKNIHDDAKGKQSKSGKIRGGISSSWRTFVTFRHLTWKKSKTP